jgi:ribosomal protein S18 acetylase RimI-like enzyme
VNARVRPARPADAAAIGRVHAESWRLTYAGLLSPRYLASLDEEVLADRWRQRLLAARPAASLLVAEDGGDVVGFSLYGPTAERDLEDGFAGEIQMLYVSPTGQRRGHGRALYDRSATDLAARPLYWLAVWVVEHNRAARAFYQRVGLAADGARRTDTLGGDRVEVLRYAGPLNPVRFTSGTPGPRPR